MYLRLLTIGFLCVVAAAPGRAGQYGPVVEGQVPHTLANPVTLNGGANINANVNVGGADTVNGTDWLAQLIPFSTNDAQLGVLSMRGAGGITAGTRTSDNASTGAQGNIPLLGFAINDNANNVQTSYGVYTECRRYTGTGICQGTEFDTINAGESPAMTPFGIPTMLSAAGWFSCGRGDALSTACSVGLGIVNNGVNPNSFVDKKSGKTIAANQSSPYITGIIFGCNAISGVNCDGSVSSSAPLGDAVLMTDQQRLRWMAPDQSFGASITSSVSGAATAQKLVFADTGFQLQNGAGTPLLNVPVGNVTDGFTLQPGNGTVSLSATGLDANVDMLVNAKGAGVVKLGSPLLSVGQILTPTAAAQALSGGKDYGSFTVNVPNDTQTASTGIFGYAPIVAQDTVQAGFTGARMGIYSQVFIKGAPASGTDNLNYVGGYLRGVANVNVGGTSSAQKGALFGSNPVAELQAGGTNWLDVTGEEIDVGMYSGASTAYRTGLRVFSYGTAKGSLLDSGIQFGVLAAGDTGWKRGITFASFGGASNPVTDILISGAGDGQVPLTAGEGIDFGAYTFSALDMNLPGSLGPMQVANTGVTSAPGFLANAGSPGGVSFKDASTNASGYLDSGTHTNGLTLAGTYGDGNNGGAALVLAGTYKTGAKVLSFPNGYIDNGGNINTTRGSTFGLVVSTSTLVGQAGLVVGTGAASGDINETLNGNSGYLDSGNHTNAMTVSGKNTNGLLLAGTFSGNAISFPNGSLDGNGNFTTSQTIQSGAIVANSLLAIPVAASAPTLNGSCSTVGASGRSFSTQGGYLYVCDPNTNTIGRVAIAHQ